MEVASAQLKAHENREESQEEGAGGGRAAGSSVCPSAQKTEPEASDIRPEGGQNQEDLQEDLLR